MVASVAQAQQIKTYEGALNLPSDLKPLGELYSVSSNVSHSHGSYQYYENADGDRIKHGSFRFLSTQIHYPDVLIEGRYSHGKKDGKWTIQRINNKGEMVKPHLGTTYNHHCGGFTINYKNDFLSGDYLMIGVSDGGIYETHYSGNIVNGRIQGIISFKKTKTTSIKDNTLAGECEMSGEIGGDGMPTGVWTVSDKDGIEKVQRRFFRNGALIAIDEMDNSTGERTLCYCAFDGLKKVPKMEEIRDSVSENDSFIIYNGQIAIKIRDDKNIAYNSHLGRYSMGDNGVCVAIPESLLKLSETIKKQVDSWNYVYSEKEMKKRVQAEIERKNAEIKKAQQAKEYEENLAESNKRFSKKLLEYINNGATIIETSSQKGIGMLSFNVKKKTKLEIKRASDDGGGRITLWVNDNLKYSGEFRKEYLINDMRETYSDPEFTEQYKIKAYSTSSWYGSMIIFSFVKDSVYHVYFVKDDIIYEFEDSAIKMLKLDL